MRRLSCLMVIFLWGCSQSGPGALPLFPVTGTAKLDGKPLADTTVSLMPVDSTSRAKPAIGVTDKEGNFKLSTNGDRGAAAGSYKVVLGGQGAEETSVKRDLTPQEQVQEVSKKQADLVKNQGRPAAKKYKFPAAWADAKTTPKTYDVSDKNPNVLNIDI